MSKSTISTFQLFQMFPDTVRERSDCKSDANTAWEDFLIRSAHAGLNIKNSVTNRSLFIDGYYAGRGDVRSLQGQLAQAEEMCRELQLKQYDQ